MSYYRKQYRCSKNNYAYVIHEHSHEYKEYIYHEHYDIWIFRDGIEEVKNLSGKILKDVEPREHGNGIEHYHNNPCCYRAFNYYSEKCLPVESLIYKDSYGNTVDNCQSRGFCRRHYSAVYTAKYHYRHEKSRYSKASSLHEHLVAFFSRTFSFDKNFLIVAKHPEVDNAQKDYCYYAGAYGRKETGKDRDTAYPRKDYQSGVWRDQKSKKRCIGHQRTGMTHRVAACLETGEHYSSYTGKGGASSSANRAEDGTGNNTYYSEAAPYMTDKDVDHINKLFGYTAPLHDAAGKNEHGDRYQRDRVHLGKSVR